MLATFTAAHNPNRFAVFPVLCLRSVLVIDGDVAVESDRPRENQRKLFRHVKQITHWNKSSSKRFCPWMSYRFMWVRVWSHDCSAVLLFPDRSRPPEPVYVNSFPSSYNGTHISKNLSLKYWLPKQEQACDWQKIQVKMYRTQQRAQCDSSTDELMNNLIIKELVHLLQPVHFRFLLKVINDYNLI